MKYSQEVASPSRGGFYAGEGRSLPRDNQRPGHHFPDHGSKEISTNLMEQVKKQLGLEISEEAMFFGESTVMLSYPVNLEPDTNNTLLVTFPDIPEAISVGDDEGEALLNGLDALESAIEIYFDEKREVPMPSKPKKGQHVVTLPALVVTKVLLQNEMLRQGVRKSELARRLNVHMLQVDRLLDPRHSSKLEAIEAALTSLGKRLKISLA